jgi:hypothetical protein
VSRVCTVCSHEHRYEIEERLAARQGTYRGISRSYGLSEDAVSRHVKGGHIAQLIKLAADAERAARADSLLDRIEALQSRTLAILEATEQTSDHRTALAAIREARSNLELIGEVNKELDRAPTLNLHLNPEWIEMRTLILHALEPHQDALSDVLAALEGDGNGAGRL